MAPKGMQNQNASNAHFHPEKAKIASLRGVRLFDIIAQIARRGNGFWQPGMFAYSFT